MLDLAKQSPLQFLKKTWNKSKKFPLGPKIFSKIFGRLVPYTGSIQPEIIELREGFAIIAMADNKKVRNHLNSIHAMALANLGEAATGLALNFALPEDYRAILRKFEIEYLKKGRGRLRALCEVALPLPLDEGDVLVSGCIMNEKDEHIAQITATWRIGPQK